MAGVHGNVLPIVEANKSTVAHEKKTSRLHSLLIGDVFLGDTYI